MASAGSKLREVAQQRRRLPFPWRQGNLYGNKAISSQSDLRMFHE
jgi:hypothetical protein